MRLYNLAIVLALAPLAGARATEAQEVRAQVVDEVTQMPLHGAIVLLLDDQGRHHVATLANSTGRSVLVARSPGVYSVRVQRIGYESTRSEPFDLQAGSVHEVRLAAPRVAVSLAAVNVRGEQRCRIRPGEGTTTLRLLEEARKTLRATALTASQRPPELVVRRYERDLEMPSERVQWEWSQKHTLRGGRSFVSIPQEDLARGGYARVDNGKLRLFAPDIEVLLSDEFLSSHCFKLEAAAKEQRELIGVGFEPIGGGTNPDIAGVLWLDRASAELRHVEISYRQLPSRFAAGHYRARLEFRGIGGGAWIVDRWWIRMPRALTREVPVAAQGSILAGRERVRERVVREEGGEVLAITGVGTETDGRATRATVAGSVFDSTRGMPLSGAAVALTGTGYAAVTSQDGRFQLRDLPAGSYTVVLRHPRLDSLGFEPDSQIVNLRAGQVTELGLAIPAEKTIRAIACPDSTTRANGLGAVFGTAWQNNEGQPAVNATVSATWTEWDGNALALTGQNREARTQTNARGFYRLCGVPPDNPLRLRATAEAGSTTATLVLQPGAHVRLDIVLNAPRRH